MGIVEGIAAHEAEKFAGVALGAAGGPVGAVIAFLKAYWKPLLLVIAAIIIAVTVISHFGNDRHVRKERDGLQNWQNMVLATVRAEVPAERRNAVTSSEVAAEIQWLGRERRTLAKALDDQSAALRVAQAKAASAQNGVTAALEGAKERDKARSALRGALTNPKRSTGLTAAEWGKL